MKHQFNLDLTKERYRKSPSTVFLESLSKVVDGIYCLGLSKLLSANTVAVINTVFFEAYHIGSKVFLGI